MRGVLGIHDGHTAVRGVVKGGLIVDRMGTGGQVNIRLEGHSVDIGAYTKDTEELGRSTQGLFAARTKHFDRAYYGSGA